MPTDNTDDVNDTALRLAALELLIVALDPAAPADTFNNTILALLDPVEVDGRPYVDADQLRRVLNEAVAASRSLLPEQPTEVERAIDEAYDAIADEVERLTAPKPQH